MFWVSVSTDKKRPTARKNDCQIDDIMWDVKKNPCQYLKGIITEICQNNSNVYPKCKMVEITKNFGEVKKCDEVAPVKSKSTM